MSRQEFQSPKNFLELRDFIASEPHIDVMRRNNIVKNINLFIGMFPAAGLHPPTAKYLRLVIDNQCLPTNSLENSQLASMTSEICSALKWCYAVRHGFSEFIHAYSTDWHALIDRVPKNSYFKQHFCRFARFASLKCIAPSQVDDTTLVQFGAYLEEVSIANRSRDYQKYVAQVWNELSTNNNNCRMQILQVSVENRRGHPPGDFAQAFHDDLARYVALMNKGNDGSAQTYSFSETSVAVGKRNALSSDTIKSRIWLLRRAACLLAAYRNTKLRSINSLLTLVAPGAAQGILTQLMKELDNSRAPTIHNMVVVLEAMSKSMLPEDVETHKRLKVLKSHAVAPSREMTINHANLLRSLTANDVATLYSIPRHLRSRVDLETNETKSLSLENIIDAQVAVGIAILLNAPLRLRNLVMIKLEQHLIFSALNSTATLLFQRDETKGRVKLELSLGTQAVCIINWYLSEILPRISNRVDPMALFPGKNGTRDRGNFAKRITERIEKILLRPWHPHLFRHLAAFQYLQKHPGNYEAVRILLGHKHIDTTRSHYCGVEEVIAARAAAKVLEEIAESNIA